MGDADKEQKDKYLIKNWGNEKLDMGSPLLATLFGPYLPAQLFPGDGVWFIYIELMAW